MPGEIAALDSALARAGEDIVLRRTYGLAPRTNYVDLDPVRANVRSFKPVELVGGISQTDSKVVISPTEILRAGWPGGEVATSTVANPYLPRANDSVIIEGRKRTIQYVNPIVVQGELVRIELRVSG